MVERVGTLGEVCDASTAVVDAYLEDGDEQNYRLAHAIASSRCLIAQMEGRDLPAQDDTRYHVSAEPPGLDNQATGSGN